MPCRSLSRMQIPLPYPTYENSKSVFQHGNTSIHTSCPVRFRPLSNSISIWEMSSTQFGVESKVLINLDKFKQKLMSVSKTQIFEACNKLSMRKYWGKWLKSLVNDMLSWCESTDNVGFWPTFHRSIFILHWISAIKVLSLLVIYYGVFRIAS